jgi:uncharacterized membrane protein YdbT with pleckstrin-like domain
MSEKEEANEKIIQEGSSPEQRSEKLNDSLESYKRKFRRFSGLSRRQLTLFMVSAFGFIVSFSWNTFVQNLILTTIPPNWKNSGLLLLMTQFLVALFITFLGATVIAFVTSRRKEKNVDAERVIACCQKTNQQLMILTRLMTGITA